MFRHVTKVKNKLIDKTLSKMNSVSNCHKATSHFIRRILKLLYSQAQPNSPLCHLFGLENQDLSYPIYLYPLVLRIEWLGILHLRIKTIE